MKKCIRCNLIFQSEERVRCLYCGSPLTFTTELEARGAILFSGSTDPFRGFNDFLKAAGRQELDRKQYILGSYFHSRSFGFMYAFCRNDLKHGKTYSRFFIRPVDFFSLLSLPWLLINVIDSILFRSCYGGFCEKCQYKYWPQGDIIGHEADECAYYQEYSRIVDDIMSGQITQTENKLRQQAKEEIEQGKRSAYRDLCSQKNGIDAFWDVTGIWITICLLLYLMVRLVSPLTINFFQKIEKENAEENRN